jgi:carboxylate-amine ligase
MAVVMQDAPMDAAAWRAHFDAGRDFSLGVEEELILLDPRTLDRLPQAARAVELAGAADERFRTELPCAQLELVTGVCETLDEVVEQLLDRRRELAGALEGFARVAGAAVHPSAPAAGPLNENARYGPIIDEYGPIVRHEQVHALHVHVGVRGAERVLAVANALRSFLPEIAVLAANGPFLAGADTGLAAIRPKIAELLPRQSVPPVIESFEYLADLVRWGSSGGAFPDATQLWWEVRLHPRHPTLEVRCPDQQTTVRDSAAVAGFVLALVAWLCERHDAGEPLPVHDSVRILENRWRALRHGLAGTLLDLDTGEPVPARERVLTRIDEVAAAGARVGAARQLGWARDLAARNGTERQRAVAAERGVDGVIEHLADAFLDAP